MNSAIGTGEPAASAETSPPFRSKGHLGAPRAASVGHHGPVTRRFGRPRRGPERRRAGDRAMDRANERCGDCIDSLAAADDACRPDHKLRDSRRAYLSSVAPRRPHSSGAGAAGGPTPGARPVGCFRAARAPDRSGGGGGRHLCPGARGTLFPPLPPGRRRRRPPGDRAPGPRSVNSDFLFADPRQRGVSFIFDSWTRTPTTFS
jgi:hypothetical protein